MNMIRREETYMRVIQPVICFPEEELMSLNKIDEMLAEFSKHKAVEVIHFDTSSKRDYVHGSIGQHG